MKVKPFYKQLAEGKTLSVCSLVTDSSAATADESGLPIFPGGFFIRATGDVKEMPFSVLQKKANNNEKFLPLVKDIKRYPTMTTFVMHSFYGEVYSYDFENIKNGHKIERVRFSFGDKKFIPSGFTIQPDKCISCGTCFKVCTFNAIIPGNPYSINPAYCDECGSCYTVCPSNAVIPKNSLLEEERQLLGKQVKARYIKK